MEDKLQVLNAKKHNLVQVLKQVYLPKHDYLFLQYCVIILMNPLSNVKCMADLKCGGGNKETA